MIMKRLSITKKIHFLLQPKYLFINKHLRIYIILQTIKTFVLLQKEEYNFLSYKVKKLLYFCQANNFEFQCNG